MATPSPQSFLSESAATAVPAQPYQYTEVIISISICLRGTVKSFEREALSPLKSDVSANSPSGLTGQTSSLV